MPAPNPVVEKRLFGQEMKRLRDRAGLTQQQAAAKLGWSREKLLRIERGQVGVQPTDVDKLLAQYGISGPEEVKVLKERAENAQRPGWAQYKDVLPREYIMYLGFEEIASVMRQYHLSVVPGLLQTERYMREIYARVEEDSPRDIRRLMDARTRRQALLNAPRHPEFRIIIDEGALRRPVGSTEIMLEQLLHIRELSHRPGIVIMILPFSVGPHPGMKGPFNLLDFDDAAYDPILYLEGARRDDIDRDSDDDSTVAYLDIFEQLESMALKDVAVDRMLEELIRTYAPTAVSDLTGEEPTKPAT
jgi:transcriptional regulator with XRE-family HTH domain